MSPCDALWHIWCRLDLKCLKYICLVLIYRFKKFFFHIKGFVFILISIIFHDIVMAQVIFRNFCYILFTLSIFIACFLRHRNATSMKIVVLKGAALA